MKRWIVLSLLLVPLFASAVGFWDGNAALQRGDAEFESGLFATSNSFPIGTQITIQNQDTGKAVNATITGRIEGQSDILVLVSPKTATAIDLPQGTLARVRVTVSPSAEPSVSAQHGDQTDSSDPDFNPAAAYADADKTQLASAPEAGSAAAQVAQNSETETRAQSTAATGTQPAATAPAQTVPVAAPEAPAQEQQSTTSQTTAASGAPISEASEQAESDAIISAAQERSPEKQVFQPPREDEKFAYHPPATVAPPTVAATAPLPPQQGSAEVAGIEGETQTTPPAPSSAQAVLAPPPPALEAQSTATEAPKTTELTSPAAVPPARREAPKLSLLPPEAPAQAGQTTTPRSVVPAKGKAPAATAVQTAASLPRLGAPGQYFLQLGAYGTEKVARDLAAKIATTYPAIVLGPSSSGSALFKVVIGPLNRAESGTLLTWFRYRGFPDAFLKQQ
jgi:rare lipoprotein A (peptidoglycan hydrolase)